jgi:hypothetical protein
LSSSRSPLSCKEPVHGPNTATLAGTEYLAANAAGIVATRSRRPFAGIVMFVGNVKFSPSSFHVFVAWVGSKSGTAAAVMFFNSTNSSPLGAG